MFRELFESSILTRGRETTYAEKNSLLLKPEHPFLTDTKEVLKKVENKFGGRLAKAINDYEIDKNKVTLFYGKYIDDITAKKIKRFIKGLNNV